MPPNYLFNGKAQTRLYNPDMVLYFAVRYGRQGAYPEELYVKAIFASLLYSTQIYTVHSAPKRLPETNRRYVDLLLMRRPPIAPNYQFAFELKYLKLADADQLETAKTEALTQMQDYL